VPRVGHWFRHAFEADSETNAEPTEAERAVVERVCREVVRRHMTTPAIMFLEMSRPMNFIGAQAMTFFQPIVSALFDSSGYEVFAGFLERRASIDYLVRTIERMEAEPKTSQAMQDTYPDS
jgi:hypothetical protein